MSAEIQVITTHSSWFSSVSAGESWEKTERGHDSKHITSHYSHLLSQCVNCAADTTLLNYEVNWLFSATCKRSWPTLKVTSVTRPIYSPYRAVRTSLCLNPQAHCNLLSCSTKRQAWPGQTSSCSQDTCGHVTSRDINEAAHGTFLQNPHAYPVLESTACSGNTDPSNLCESFHNSNLMKWEYRTSDIMLRKYRPYKIVYY